MHLFPRSTPVRPVCFSLVAISSLTSMASAAFIDPVTPSWTGGANTTSQVWTTMTGTPTGSVPTAGAPLAAATFSNPNGTPVWYDAAAPADGAFNAGGDVYSFSGVLNPTAIIPGYNLPGHELKVFAEAQYFGGVIDTSSLTATYLDSSNVSHTIDVSSLPDFQYTRVFTDGGSNFGGFGTAFNDDGVWRFTLPADTTSLQLTWGWGVTSSALQGLSVYTQSVAVPEPTTSVLMLLGGLVLVAFGRCYNLRAASKKSGVA